MAIKRLLIVLRCLTVVLWVARVAHAHPTSRFDRNDWIAAYSFEQFRRYEQQAVAAVARPTPGARGADRATARRLLRSLALTNDPAIGEFVWLAQAALVMEESPGIRDFQQQFESATEKLLGAKPKQFEMKQQFCAAIRERLVEALRPGSSDRVWWEFFLCNANDDAKLNDAKQAYDLLWVVVPDGVDKLDVIAAGENRVVATQQAQRDLEATYFEARAERYGIRHLIFGSIAFLVPVPKGQQVLVHIVDAGQSRVRSVTHALDPVIFDRRVKRTCVHFDFDADPDARVFGFFNGRRLNRGSNEVLLPEGAQLERPARVTVLDASHDEPLVLDQVGVDWQQIEERARRDGCYKLEYDLRRKDMARRASIISVDVNRCDEGLVDRQILTDKAETALKGIGLLTQPLRAYADVERAYKSLVRDIAPSNRVGGNRGFLDLGAQTDSAAGEVRRTGAGSLVEVNLVCTPGGKEFTLIARRLNIQKLTERLRRRDRISGFDVRDLLSSAAVPELPIRHLEGGMRAVLSQLFGQPNVRFEIDSSRKARLQTALHERVRAYLPKSLSDNPVHLEVSIKRLDRVNEDVCATDAPSRERADDLFKDNASWGIKTAPAPADGGGLFTRVFYWQAAKPGKYLLRAKLSDGDSANETDATNGLKQAYDYRCVAIESPGFELWTDLAYRAHVWTPSEAARKSLAGYGYVLFDMRFQGSSAFLSTTVAPGLAIGYSNAAHTLRWPPSWELGTPSKGVPPSGNSDSELTWVKHSLLVGPTLSLRWSGLFCGNAVPCIFSDLDLVSRVSLLLDLGFFDSRAIHRSVPTFITGIESADLDLTSAVDLGLEYHLTEKVALHVAAGMSFIGWDDAVLIVQSEARSSIAYDAFLTWGGSIGITWAY